MHLLKSCIRVRVANVSYCSGLHNFQRKYNIFLSNLFLNVLSTRDPFTEILFIFHKLGRSANFYFKYQVLTELCLQTLLNCTFLYSYITIYNNWQRKSWKRVCSSITLSCLPKFLTHHLQKVLSPSCSIFPSAKALNLFSRN